MTMQCQNARDKIEALPVGQAPDAELQAHLCACADCTDYAEDVSLRRLLQTLPIAPAREGFEQRVLSSMATGNVATAGRPSAGWWMASAAAIVTAVMLVLLLAQPQTGGPSIEVAQVSPTASFQQVVPVSMMLSSGEDHDGATITVHVPPSVALDGYPGQRRLQWKVDLRAGDHKLTLPLIVGGGNDASPGGCEILIELEHGGKHKQFWIPVPSSAGDGRPMIGSHSA